MRAAARSFVVLPRYLTQADEAKHEATLKRRISEAEVVPSPTRAGRKANPGQRELARGWHSRRASAAGPFGAFFDFDILGGSRAAWR